MNYPWVNQFKLGFLSQVGTASPHVKWSIQIYDICIGDKKLCKTSLKIFKPILDYIVQVLMTVCGLFAFGQILNKAEDKCSTQNVEHAQPKLLSPFLMLCHKSSQKEQVTSLSNCNFKFPLFRVTCY